MDCYRTQLPATASSAAKRRSSSTVSDDELAELLSWQQQQQQQLQQAAAASSAGYDVGRRGGRRRESIAPALTHGSNFGRVEVQCSVEHAHYQTHSIHNADERADVVGLSNDVTRYPWQRDVSVQCTIVSTSMVEGLLAPDDVTTLLKPQLQDETSADEGLAASGQGIRSHIIT